MATSKEPFVIKRNDLLEPIEMRAVDEDGNAVDLNAEDVVSMKFIMTRDGAAAPTISNGEITIVQEGTGGGATNLGVCQYEWQSGDTDKDGRYWAEVEITFTGSKPKTFPTKGYIPIVIEPDLG